MPTYSTTFNESLNRTSTDEQPLLLLEITHGDLATPIRLVNDTQDIPHSGNVYTAVPFRATLPDDLGEGLPTAELSIDNVGRDLMIWLESADGGEGAQVRMIQILRSDPNTIEWDITLELTGVSADIYEVKGTLGFENLLNKAAMIPLYDRQWAPSL